MRDGYVRLYNEMPPDVLEEVKGPIEFGFDGKAYVVQPKGATFKRVAKKHTTPFPAMGVQLAATTYGWERQPGGNETNWLDVPAKAAEWAFSPANFVKHRQYLVPHERKRADLEEELLAAREVLEREQAKLKAQRAELDAERAALFQQVEGAEKAKSRGPRAEAAKG